MQCFQRFLSVLLEDVFGKSHLVIPQVPEHKQEQNHVAESTLLGAAKWLNEHLKRKTGKVQWLRLEFEPKISSAR